MIQFEWVVIDQQYWFFFGFVDEGVQLVEQCVDVVCFVCCDFVFVDFGVGWYCCIVVMVGDDDDIVGG